MNTNGTFVAQRGRDVVAHHVGEEHVDDGRGRPLGRDRVERGPAAGREDGLPPLRLDEPCEEPEQLLVVVDEQDLRSHARATIPAVREAING
jgi:hypothetical protein